MILFALVDLVLLALCGVIALRLPSGASDPLPEGGLTSVAKGIGIVAMVRGLWRLVTLVPWLLSASESDAASSSFTTVFVGISIASTVVLFVTGVLIAQQKISEQSTSPFVKDTLGEIASFVWPARHPFAIGALLCAAAQIVPYAMLRF